MWCVLVCVCMMARYTHLNNHVIMKFNNKDYYLSLLSILFFLIIHFCKLDVEMCIKELKCKINFFIIFVGFSFMYLQQITHCSEHYFSTS
jgi:hypothetical protein